MKFDRPFKISSEKACSLFFLVGFEHASVQEHWKQPQG